MSEIPKEIAAALVVAQRATHGVEKGKTADVRRKDGSKGYSYDFASGEMMIAAGRDALHEAGLALIQPTWALEGKDVVTLAFTLVHESGVSHAFPPVPAPYVEGPGRPRDKALAGAITYMTGYFLRGLLQLPRTDKGTSVDERDDSGYEPRRREEPSGPPPYTPGKVMLGANRGFLLSDMAPEALTRYITQCRAWLAKQGEGVDPVWADYVDRQIAESEAVIEAHMAEEALSQQQDEPPVQGPNGEQGSLLEGS